MPEIVGDMWPLQLVVVVVVAMVVAAVVAVSGGWLWDV